MAKRTKKDFAPHIDRTDAPRCEAAGCEQAGLYKAPKGKSNLREYRYFCLDHIREYNSKWDFFTGMSPEEIEAFTKDAITGHRPTWERAQQHIPNANEKLYDAVNDFLYMGGRKKTKGHPRLSSKLSKALALFDIEYPYTAINLKRKYKALVKQYHPDRNQGDKLAEEKFKAIASAYKVLDAHLSE